MHYSKLEKNQFKTKTSHIRLSRNRELEYMSEDFCDSKENVGFRDLRVKKSLTLPVSSCSVRSVFLSNVIHTNIVV